MNGVELIWKERQRQVGQEGWTQEHDDEHDGGELTSAGVAYALVALEQVSGIEHWGESRHVQFWPWDMPFWKPSDDPIRNLVKAGALIAAEIDRLQGTKNDG